MSKFKGLWTSREEVTVYSLYALRIFLVHQNLQRKRPKQWLLQQCIGSVLCLSSSLSSSNTKQQTSDYNNIRKRIKKVPCCISGMLPLNRACMVHSLERVKPVLGLLATETYANGEMLLEVSQFPSACLPQKILWTNNWDKICHCNKISHWLHSPACWDTSIALQSVISTNLPWLSNLFLVLTKVAR